MDKTDLDFINDYLNEYCKKNNIGTEENPIPAELAQKVLEEVLVIYSDTPQKALGGLSPNQLYKMEMGARDAK